MLNINQWHPLKARRKSLLHTVAGALPTSAPDLQPTDPMTASASGIELPNFSLAPQFQARPLGQSNFMNLSPQNRGFSQQTFNLPSSLMDQSSAASTVAQVVGARAAPSGDINLQIQPVTSLDNSWLQQNPQMLAAQNQPSMIGTLEQQQQQLQQASAPQQAQQQQQQQPTRRFGDITSFQQQQQQQELKPVNSDRLHSNDVINNVSNSVPSLSSPQSPSNGFLSSLTSSLASGQSRFINKIINANANSGLSSYKMISLGESPRKLLEARQDQLSDKHRYSLVGLDSNENDLAHSNGNSLSYEQSQKLSPSSSKPFLLSAMTHAITSMFNPQIQHESGSLSPSSLQGDKQQIFFGDKTINLKETLSRRHQQATGSSNNNGAEQRDLSQFLPQTWQDLAKRTMSNVKQQATSQWKSIEGQLTNWVQDKLKTFPATSSPSTSASQTTSSNAPVSNLIATVSSTAMNILGLGNKSLPANSANVASAGSTTTTTTNNANDSNAQSSADGNNQKSKNDLPSRSSSSPSSAAGKGTLAGVANMIVNSLTSRSNSPSTSSQSKSSSSPSSPSPSASTSSVNSIESGSVASQYPTLTGAQPSSSSSSMTTGTVSTVAGISTQMV